MKRQAALLSAATMAMSMFAGMPTAAMAEESDVVTINWNRTAWHTNEDEQMVEDAINAYIEPLIGVNVNLMNASENTEISLALAAGDDVDFWWDASWATMNALIQGNSAYDLTDIIDDYPTLKASIPDNVWEGSMQNGHLWYVPIYKESGAGNGLTVPTETVEKFGWDLSTIKELKDLEPMLQDMVDDGYNQPYVINANYIHFSYFDTFANIVTSSSNQWFACVRRDDPDTIINVYEQPEMVEYLNLMHSWVEKGYIAEEELTGGGIIGGNEGYWGFYGFGAVPDAKANATARYGKECEYIKLTESYINTDTTAGSVLMVNAKTEKIDAVMKFIELLNTDETLANLAAYGIEGEHYNLVDGRVELIPDSGYSYPGVWIVCNVTTPTLMVNEAENKKEIYDEFNAELLTSVTNGFRFDNSKVQGEITAIEAVFAEYYHLLNRGAYDPEEYLPIFQEALKEAGADAVIAEMQAQWDEFRANQAEEVETEVESTTAE